jgi:hypothetical protein
MARTWFSIRVDLVEGHGERFRPRPGRIFAAARTHTFAQLADAIDDAFTRWDRSHLLAVAPELPVLPLEARRSGSAPRWWCPAGYRCRSRPGGPTF